MTLPLKDGIDFDDATVAAAVSAELMPALRLADQLSEFPVVGGNRFELLPDYQPAIARLVAEAEKKEANTRCSIASFLEGKEYHLYYRTQITDVRLVYAPPRAIGE